MRGHFDEKFIPLNRVRFALVPRGRVGRESIILPFNATRLDMSAKGPFSEVSPRGHDVRFAPMNRQRRYTRERHDSGA